MARRKKARARSTARQRGKASRSRKAVRKRRPQARMQRKVQRKAPQRAVQRRPNAAPRPRKVSPQRTAPVKPQIMAGEKEIGYISHFFSGIDVGIIELTSDMLKRGDKIRIKGQTTDFTQTVSSMQYEHQPIEQAEKGKSVGIKVDGRVRQHDKVYKIE